jgi:hypothetical protein
MQTIHLSDGTQYEARLEIWDDLHSERAGMYRLFWVVPGESTGTPAVGYCSPGGSYRTIREAIADGVRRFGETAVRVR